MCDPTRVRRSGTELEMPGHSLREGMWDGKEAKPTLSRDAPRCHANSHSLALEAFRPPRSVTTQKE